MDLNGDGHADLLSGSYSRHSQPMAGLFQVLWGQEGGSFSEATVLEGTDGEPLIIDPGSGEDDEEDYTIDAICTRPFAVDWTGDGVLDLVVGNFRGTFYVFEGETEGRFQPESRVITVNGEPLKITGVHSDPFIVDWDQDGDLDLLTGSSDGSVAWSENIAEEGSAPVLSEFKKLIEARKNRPYGSFLALEELNAPTQSVRVWVEDLNGDGKHDLLLGDSTTLVSPAEGLTEEECLARKKVWEAEQVNIQAEMQKIYNGEDLSDEEVDALNEKYAAHREKRSEFIQEERTGFVWQYIQK